MIIRVVSSLNDLIEALAFSLFLSLRLSLGTRKLCVLVWCISQRTCFYLGMRSHRDPTEVNGSFMQRGPSAWFFFSEVKFRSKTDLWPLETFGLLRFIEEEHIWGSFSFSKGSFKFHFLHILWKQNVRQRDKEEKINYFKLSSCWERNPGGETLKRRIEAVWCLNMFIFNRRAI